MKPQAPVFASDVRPDCKPKKTNNTLPKSLHTYEIRRDKVVNDMQPKAPKPEPKPAGKKKLLS